MANTWFYKVDKRKITYSASGCETEIDFLLVGEKYRTNIRDVKVSLWELQHRLVVVVVVVYPTPSEGWGHGGRPWSPRSWATPQGLDQRS